jgi:ribosomal protein L11 methyltransferase
MAASQGVAEVPVDGLGHIVELLIGFERGDDAVDFSELLAGHGYRAGIERASSVRWARPGTVDVATSGGTIALEVLTAFGHGGHPTTRLALEGLEHLALPEDSTVLDVGCGTGILSIAAARLGHRAVGCDLEAEAVAISARNAERNTVGARTDFVVASPVDLIIGRWPCPPAGFDAILANVPIGVHETIAAALDRLAAPASPIVVTGILLEQGERALAAYAPRHEIDRASTDGWLRAIMRR